MPLPLARRSLFLKLGGEEVEYDPGFQLYLQTKLSNPHYKPEIAAQVRWSREYGQLSKPNRGVDYFVLQAAVNISATCTTSSGVRLRFTAMRPT